MSQNTEARQKTREYETIYILRQDVDADGADKIAHRIADVVGREHGTLVKVENWGRRRLAYDVAKQKRGVYYYLKFLGAGAIVAEVERNLRMLDQVLKFQTVQLRDEVDVSTVTVDPEEIKFARLEPPTPEETADESRERELGLVFDAPEQAPRQQVVDAPTDDVPADGEAWTRGAAADKTEEK